VQLIQRIQELLYQEHLTIQAARKKLAEETKRQENPGQLGLLLPDPEVTDSDEDAIPMDREEIVESLREVLDLLRFGRRSW
jgi:hypothetical protein